MAPKRLQFFGSLGAVFLILFANTVFAFTGPAAGLQPGEGSGAIYVDGAGRLGIGTTNPLEILSIASSSARLFSVQRTGYHRYGFYQSIGTGLHLQDFTIDRTDMFFDGAGGVVVGGVGTATSTFNVLGSSRATGGFFGVGSSITSLDPAHTFGGPFSSANYAFPLSLAVGTSTTTNLPQTLSVYGGGYFSGNVGIGTTAPNSALEVKNAIPLISYNRGGSYLWKAGVGNGTLGIPSSYFGIRDDSAGTVPFMIAHTSGNVGIGTSTPPYKLSVQGPIYSTGSSTASSFCLGGVCQTSWATLGQWTTTSTGIFYNGGNVGIGTTAPRSILDIGDSGVLTGYSFNGKTTTSYGRFERILSTTSHLDFSGTSATDAIAMRIDSSGNVGIGTTAPVGGLHVAKTGTIAALVVDEPANNAVAHMRFRDSNNTRYRADVNIAQGGGLQFNAYDDTGGVYQTVTFDGNPVVFRLGATEKMRVHTDGNVGILTTTPQAPLHVVGNVIGDTPTAANHLTTKGYVDTAITFVSSTLSSSTLWASSGNNIYNLNSAGNVGIGTTTPTYKLDIAGGTNNILRISGSNTANIVFDSGSTNSWGVMNGYVSGGKFQITKGTVGSLPTSAVMTFDTAGNVGIGTTAPNKTLHVAGDIRGGIYYNTNSSDGWLIAQDSGTNRGLYFYNSAGTWDFFDGGVSKVSINTSGNVQMDGILTVSGTGNSSIAGNVGIATTTPTTKLDIYGNGTVWTPTGSNHIATKSYVDTVAGAAQTAYWNLSGSNLYPTSTSWNVGIGTATPGAKLDIQNPSTTTVPALSVLGAGQYGSGYHVSLGNYSKISQNSAGQNFITWGAYNNGTAWTRSYSGSLGLVNLAVGTGPYFSVQTDEATSGTPNFVDRLTVANGGKVGIGTTAPTKKLEIQAGTPTAGANEYAIKLKGTYTTNNWTGILFGATHDNSYNKGGIVYKATEGSTLRGQLQFLLNATADAGTNATVDTDARMVVDYSGNVGIGTTAPSNILTAGFANTETSQSASAVLNIFNSNATANNMANIAFGQSGAGSNGFSRLGVIYTDRTGSSEDQDMFFGTIGAGTYGERMRIKGTGNIGIATTTPQAALHVVGNVIGDTPTAANHLTTKAYVDTAITFVSSTLSSSTLWAASGNNIYNLNSANVGVGTTTPPNLFSVATTTNILSVTSGGNVGIGIATPSSKLSVSGGNITIFPNGRLIIDKGAAGASGGGYFEFINSNPGIVFGITDNSDNNNIVFKTRPADNVERERMRITSLGRIGIATTTPQAALHVVGNVIGDTPTATNHLTTKAYVDSMFTGSGQWTTSGSYVYLTSTTQRVGIGTTAPNAKLHINGGVGSLATGLSFGDGDSGIYEFSDDNFRFLAGSAAFVFRSTDFQAGGDGATSPGVRAETASLTNPVFVPINDDPDTGLGGNGANIVSLIAGGVNGLNVDSAGNVGIGTTTPSSLLSINGHSTYAPDGIPTALTITETTAGVGNLIRIVNGTEKMNIGLSSTGDALIGQTAARNTYIYGGTTVKMTILSGGSVGIATTTPQAKLHVIGNVIGDTPTAANHLTTKAYVDTAITFVSSTLSSSTLWAASGNNIYNLNSANVGIGRSDPTYALDVEGTIRFGQSTNGYALLQSGSWGAEMGLTDENDTAIAVKYSDTGSYQFGGVLGGSNGILISSTGNVGIGTINPERLLHVNSSEGDTYIRVATEEINSNVGYEMTNDVLGQAWTTGYYGGDYVINNGLQFGGNNIVTVQYGAPVNTFYIKDTGGVGIATSTPTTKFDIYGNGTVWTPTGSNHIATKSYVDTVAGAAQTAYWNFSGNNLFPSSTSWNVGIGTTNPSFKLVVDGEISTQQVFVVDDVDTTNRARFAVGIYPSYSSIQSYGMGSSNGYLALNPLGNNVGIGTTAPDTKLHIYGGDSGVTPVAGSLLTIEDDTSTGVYIQTPDANMGTLLFGTASDAFGAYLRWDYMANLMTLSTARSGADLAFLTSNGAEAIRILDTGNVGIGTTAPAGRFDVQDGTGTQTAGDLLVDSVGHNVYIGQLDASADNTNLIVRDRLGNAKLTVPGAQASHISMAVVGGGNVGIATTTPQAKLHVIGNVIGDTPTAANHLTTKNYVDSMFTGSGQWTTSGSYVYLTSTTQRVGIGTTAPASQLEIATGAANGGKLKFDTITNANGGSTLMEFSEEASSSIGGAIVYAGHTNPDFGHRSFTLPGNSFNIVTNGGSDVVAMTVLRDSGNVGIGTTAPGTKLHVNAAAVASTGEELARFTVADDATAYLSIKNVTGSNNTFIPGISTLSGSVSVSRLDLATITTDSGTEPAFVYDARLAGGAIATRPLFDWGSYGNSKMRILANGNVGIGTTNPGAPLQVGNPTYRYTGTTPVAHFYDATRSTALRIQSANTGAGNYGPRIEFEPYSVDANSVKTAIVAVDNYYGYKKTDLFFVLDNANDTNIYDISTDTKMVIKNNGSVGIATTTPQAALHVVGNVIGDTPTAANHLTTKAYVDTAITFVSSTLSSSTLWAASGNNIYNLNSANVGIGTATPDFKLDISGAMRIEGTNSLSWAGTASNDWSTRMYSSGGNFYVNTNGFFINDGGYTGTKNYLSILSGGNVGIGATNPSAKLDVFKAGTATLTDITQNTSNNGIAISSDYVTGYYPGVMWYTTNSDPTKPKAGIWSFTDGNGSRLFLGTSGSYATGITNTALTVNWNGNIGIATTTPTTKFDIYGNGTVWTPTAPNHIATKGYVDTALGGTSSSTSNYVLKTGDSMSGNLNMDNNNIIGVNKLTVSTIDPVYTIDGKKYATYVSDSIGIKVHAYGKGKISSGGTYIIDFKKAAKGSDEWLFWQTIYEGENMSDVMVLLTPEGTSASLWYELKSNTKQIVIYSSKATKFSYQLSAPRHDTHEWGNVLLDSEERGITLPLK